MDTQSASPTATAHRMHLPGVSGMNNALSTGNLVTLHHWMFVTFLPEAKLLQATRRWQGHPCPPYMAGEISPTQFAKAMKMSNRKFLKTDLAKLVIIVTDSKMTTAQCKA